MTAPRLTCQLPHDCRHSPSCQFHHDSERCGYEADSYSELRAHMGASHKSR